MGGPDPAEGKQAELDSERCTPGKTRIPVFEVVQADQRPAVHQVGEELFGRVIGGDAGRDYNCRTGLSGYRYSLLLLQTQSIC